MKNKILFVIDGYPNNYNAGGILIGKIIQQYGTKQFHFIIIGQKIVSNNYMDEISKNCYISIQTRLHQTNIFNRILNKIPLFSFLYLYFKLTIKKKQIINWAKEKGCDLVFTILRGDCLLVLNTIVDELGIPIIGYDTDTIEAEYQDDRLLYNQKKQEFEKLIPRLSSMATIGESMQMYYKEKYGVNSHILRLPYIQNIHTQRRIINEVNIIFLGNLYSSETLNKFLMVIDRWSRYNHDYSITIYAATHSHLTNSYSRIKIINLGWIGEKKLHRVLDKCHLAYLPYKFGNKYRHQFKYSFPSKAGMYISSGLPIFFHGPDYSSFNTFLEKYSVGLSCCSMAEIDIINSFEKLITNKLAYEEYQNECYRAYREEFSNRVFGNKLITLFSNNTNV